MVLCARQSRLGLARKREAGCRRIFASRWNAGLASGRCPIYRVTITGDGQVSYDGQRFVAVTGHRTRAIAPAEVEALARAFERAGFFSLKDGYRAHVTDLPAYRLTLSADGRTKTVTDYGGRMIGMPQAVSDLEQRVDDTAGTQMWVKPNAD